MAVGMAAAGAGAWSGAMWDGGDAARGVRGVRDPRAWGGVAELFESGRPGTTRGRQGA